MTSASVPAPSAVPDVDHVDVLIVGAGLSGIGAAYHLQTKLPGKSYAILEGRDAIGGTWDLFRYPGIRSDSDLHTLGYAFKPWTDEKAIADGPAILAYIRQTARENGIDRRIRFGHRVVRAEWSSADARWTVEATRSDDGATVAMTCDFLFAAGGYYRYDEGFTPHFEGRERFQGQIVHPQQWPEDLDYAGKRVVVIGSGATAVTLVPAMAEEAAHVTMLQRSPTYIVSVPSRDPIANALRRVLPNRVAYSVARRKNVALQALVYKLSRRRPGIVRRLIRAAVKRQLPDGYAVDTHFKPHYDPWDQRLCVVPDGDLFKAISSARASIVTDRIASFTERGVALASGTELEADIVVTATGLNLVAFGGVEYVVDGEPVVLADTFAYRGAMLSGVPNFAFAVGYINASWTLKVDLVCDWLCRLLAHMDSHGYAQVVPVNDDTDLPRRPLLDFSAGYVQRALDSFPKQGPAAPWRMSMSYREDVRNLRDSELVDGTLRFTRRPAVERQPDGVAA
ncbi:MAG TPA: NAD(P)/FAD-dependent oxidoreductase [Thermoleophilaceae bacterium]|nr:NAD(P)/FAD-dependent oxidoreductase [Thermoleophilaceae bacterium]